ncbi:amastin-like protein [Leishmania braziliensis MHOM/BR/75/M2904]|uniref:Amastin-like protein n=1 Tax=Leishmania braziliensis TaxID=5660 RepID=A4H5G6_LEIBR|nr:amastin-like protein [Leishmania braziliensis MHOM/BR/75/M2904]CAM37193.1 amastin-like protein [Leishmania braziliensis MHOM/BR/75/M2904]
MKWNPPLIAYAIIQLIAFFFVLLATPIDMYRFRREYITPNTTVTTLWGVKMGPLNTTNVIPTYILWRQCPARLNRFLLAQAFAVISILIYGAATVLGFIKLYCCDRLRMVCVVLNSVGAVTLCIVWGVVAMTYHMYEGPDCWQESVFSTYGAGFVLLLLAWLLDLFNIVILLLPLIFPEKHVEKNRKVACNEAQGIHPRDIFNDSWREAWQEQLYRQWRGG